MPCSATWGVGTSSSLMTMQRVDSVGRGAGIQSVQENPAENRNTFPPAPVENPARVQRSFPLRVPVLLHFVVTKMTKWFNSVYYPLIINYTIVTFRRISGTNVHTMSLEGAGRVFSKAGLCHSATPKPLAAEVAVGAGPALGKQESCWSALGPAHGVCDSPLEKVREGHTNGSPWVWNDGIGVCQAEKGVGYRLPASEEFRVRKGPALPQMRVQWLARVLPRWGALDGGL